MTEILAGPASQGRRRRLAFVVFLAIGLVTTSAVLGALALVATAADGRPPTEPIYIDTVDVAVEIYSFHYVPAIISVPSGAHVTWTNHDPEQHTATRADGTWDTGLMSLDGTGQITFETPGVYHYTCTLHPHMHGEITVRR